MARRRPAPVRTIRPDADAGAGRRAEDLFLAWLLALPPEIDPSHAATTLLLRIDAGGGATPPTGEAARLRTMLEETRSWQPSTLASPPSTHARRRRTTS